MSESTPVLEVQQASKRFGVATALAGVDLTVARGEWLGLLGPNGAGKTTLIRAIAGRIRLDAGRVTLRGRVGLVPQETAIYPFLTARENLEIFGALHGLRGETLRERVAWALAWTGLADRTAERTEAFSGGMKRRLNLACGVLHRPALILLDEPTVGVDPQSRARIFAMLAELRADGAAFVHTTHQLGEAEDVCTRVVIIDHGLAVATGTPAALIEQTLGTGLDAVVTLDREPSPPSLPAGARVDGRHIRLGLADVPDGLPALLGALRQAGYGVEDVHVVRPDLAAVFLRLTGRELRE